MSVQHVFHGEGDPNDLGIIAPAGSHFVNDLDSDAVWIATYSEPADGENPAYTRWVKLEQRWPVLEVNSNRMDPGNVGDSEAVITGGQFLLARGVETVYSNVPLEQHTNTEGDYWRYYSATPYRLSVSVTTDGNVALLITELQAQTWE